MKLKKGCVAVQLGLENGPFQRFVIPISHLHNPYFQRLLVIDGELYGYQTSGPLMIPCSIKHFLCLQQCIATESTIVTTATTLLLPCYICYCWAPKLWPKLKKCIFYEYLICVKIQTRSPKSAQIYDGHNSRRHNDYKFLITLLNHPVLQSISNT